METKQHNGWTNYETWVVKLWIDDDQGSQEYWREQASECYENNGPTNTFSHSEHAAFILTGRLKDEFEENNPLSDINTVYVDLLNAALSEVNWYEIAKHMIDSLIEENKNELANV